MNLDAEHSAVNATQDSGVTCKRMPATYIAKLYGKPLPSTRTGPLYNAFSYPTKISPESIAVYIAAHTEPGAVVLDAFAGSGSTGLAALLCDRPTRNMKQMAEQLRVRPRWGPRVAHLFEIGTLGAFISDTLCHPPEPDVFAAAVDELCIQAEKRLGQLYAAKDPSGAPGRLRHAIWSDVLVCPHCRTEVSLWDAAIKTKPLAMGDSFRCKGCLKHVLVENCKRATESTTDAAGRKHTTKKRLLARVHGQTGTRKWQRPPTPDDAALVRRIQKMPVPASAPDADIEWGDLHRSGYHLGIDKLHHFYTRRNFIVIATLMELAARFPVKVREALKMLILSYNASHSTLMTRVVLKKNQKDFVLTGAQSGVLYISGLPVEKNILEGLRRKAKAFIDSFRMVHGSASEVVIHNTSSEYMPLETRSVDYVFTDPPFGDYIPYAELNQINELWLGRKTDRSREIIVSSSQAKGITQYRDMMQGVFQEIFRVLKPQGKTTVAFHSAHSEVWRALTHAYAAAGFSIEATSVLDKIQASFKQVISNVSVKGDPLLLLSKRASRRRKTGSGAGIARKIILGARNLPSPDPQHLYSLFIRSCLETGHEIDMDARTFHELVAAEARS